MNIEEIKKSALADIENAASAGELEKIRVRYLGRKGKLTAVLRSLKNLSLEERRRIGPHAQKLKKELEEKIDKKISTFYILHSTSPIDLTAPAKRISRGHLHPLTIVERDIRRIFLGMNFSVIEGPEVESEYYNFDALNVPDNHPAKDMWDTFWIKKMRDKKLEMRGKSPNLSSLKAESRSHLLLRTHTSPMQIRYMETHQPPFQIICPGRVFRYEATDQGHEINFYQLEGLVVGKNITLANMKFVFEEFLKHFFGRDVEFRYRPSYFPFVEPGWELVVKYQGKWFEVMPGGMVHPRVFEYAGYNPRDWQGFAFGFGLDRLAMIKYKIPDIRLFYSGDLRFIRQF